MMLLLCRIAGYSQSDSVVAAGKYHGSGNFNRAKIAIDAASQNPKTKNNAYTWYLRSFIYKDMYKTQEKNNKQSTSRMESLKSCKKTIEIDTDNDNKLLADSLKWMSDFKKMKNEKISDTAMTRKQEIKSQVIKITEQLNKISEGRMEIAGRKSDMKQILKFLSASFYNDYVGVLDENNYEDAIVNFNFFKENMQFADSGYNLTPKTVEFKMALATIYEKIFNADQKKNKNFFDKAETQYKDVLLLDANNVTANYNLAMIYYNCSVSVINSMNSETDIVELMSLQDGCIDLFKKSLPYMLKAYELNPKRIETLKGLQGIYFSLSEVEKSDEIKKQIQALEK